MRHELRLFFIALQFLTRIPVPAWVGFDAAWLNQSVRHFPLAGACVGLFGALVFALGLALFPPVVAVLLSMIATVWLTGAFHEDGLADTCDGLGAAVSRERSLEIMKDSRIGTYGVCGLVLVLGVKAAALIELAQLHPVLACLALVWGHAASRTAPVWLMWATPYAGDTEQARAKPLAAQVRGSDVVVALLWTGLLTVAVWLVAAWFDLRVDEVDLIAWGLIAASIGIAVTTLLAARWLRKRLGGFTGDTLGAVQQVTELVSLLAWLAVAHALAGSHG